MAATLAELLRERTVEEAQAILLSVLQSEQFPVTDWNEGGAARVFVQAIATAIADKSTLIATIASGGFASLAADLRDSEGNEVEEWLDLIAKYFYELERSEATFTKQRCEITCFAGTGPQTVNPGFVVLSPTSGKRYIYNGSAVVVGDGLTVAFEFTAENPGSSYSDTAGKITEIVTPLPGLTVTNPTTSFGGLDAAGKLKRGSANSGTGTITPTGSPILERQFTVKVVTGGNQPSSGVLEVEVYQNGVRSVTPVTPIPLTYDAGDGITLTFSNGAGFGFVTDDVHTFTTPGSPILQQGSDKENNAALAARCMARWPDLSENILGDKYLTWIRKCSLDNGFGVDRITLRASATVAGVTEIIVATASGAPGGPAVSTMQTYVNARNGISDDATVTGAVNQNVVPVGTVVVKLEDFAAVQAAADKTWAAYIKSLPIGGDITTGSPGVVRVAELYQAVMDAGAIDFTGVGLTGVALGTNLPLTDFDYVAVIESGSEPSWTLIWQTVA